MVHLIPFFFRKERQRQVETAEDIFLSLFLFFVTFLILEISSVIFSRVIQGSCHTLRKIPGENRP